MKLFKINTSISKYILRPAKIGLVAGLTLFPMQKASAPNNSLTRDVFEHIELAKQVPKPESIKNIPPINPNLEIAGELKIAAIVVDTKQNKLYHIDSNGELIKEYEVATGKSATPTVKGVRKVTWVESYPYNSAPEISKRRKAPWDYGPKIIVIGVVDKTTGEVTHFNGEFIHGTNKPQSIGTYASKGCVRMRNDDIKELSAQMEKGMFVVIK